MAEEQVSFLKMNGLIFRYSQGHLDRVLKKYELSNGSFRYLFVLEEHKGISQNNLSKRIGHDKAMSARTISKLIQLGYVYREADESDKRAYHLFLTEKAIGIIPLVRKELDQLGDRFTEGLTEEEKRITLKSLEHIYDKIVRNE